MQAITYFLTTALLTAILNATAPVVIFLGLYYENTWVIIAGTVHMFAFRNSVSLKTGPAEREGENE
jgi:hypothetical protein